MKFFIVVASLLVCSVFSQENSTSDNDRFENVIEEILDYFGDHIQPLRMRGARLNYTQSFFGKKLTFEAVIESVNMTGIDSAKRYGNATFTSKGNNGTRSNGSNVHTAEGVVAVDELQVSYKGHVTINGHGPHVTVHYKIKGFKAHMAVSQPAGHEGSVTIVKYNISNFGKFVVTKVEGVPRGLRFIVRKGVSGLTRLLKSRVEKRLSDNMRRAVGQDLGVHFHSLD